MTNEIQDVPFGNDEGLKAPDYMISPEVMQASTANQDFARNAVDTVEKALVQGTPIEEIIKDLSKTAENFTNIRDRIEVAVPLNDLPQITMDFICDYAPEPMEWIIPGLIPRGIVAILAAQGGSGKSFLLLDLVLSLAMGETPWGMPKKLGIKRCKSLAIFGEDCMNEIHRRAKKTIKTREWSSENLKSIPDYCKPNLRSGPGKTLTLINEKYQFTTRYYGLLDEIKNANVSGKPYDLIVLDPLSRFSGCEENDNRAMTKVSEALEAVQQAAGPQCTVIITHHTRKTGKDGERGIDDLRGGSALKDAARLVIMITQAGEDEYGTKLKKLDMAKGNYTAEDQFRELYFETEQGDGKGGVLTFTAKRPVDPKEKKDSGGNSKGNGKNSNAQTMDNNINLLKNQMG